MTAVTDRPGEKKQKKKQQQARERGGRRSGLGRACAADGGAGLESVIKKRKTEKRYKLAD